MSFWSSRNEPVIHAGNVISSGLLTMIEVSASSPANKRSGKERKVYGSLTTNFISFFDSANSSKPRISLPLEDCYVDTGSVKRSKLDTVKGTDPFFKISAYDTTYTLSSKDIREIDFWYKSILEAKTSRMVIPETPNYTKPPSSETQKYLRYISVLVDYEEPIIVPSETKFIIEVTSFNRRWRVRRTLEDVCYLVEKLRSSLKKVAFPLNPLDGFASLASSSSTPSHSHKGGKKPLLPYLSVDPAKSTRDQVEGSNRDQVLAACRYCRCLLFEITGSLNPSVSQSDEMLDFLEIRSLFRGVRCGSKKHVNFLKRRGINFNIRDKDKRNALHVAALAPEGGALVIEALLAAGIEINAQDEDGNTPLCLAVQSQEQMLRHGFITSKDSLSRLVKHHSSHNKSSRASIGSRDSVGSKSSKASRGSFISFRSRGSTTSKTSRSSRSSRSSMGSRISIDSKGNRKKSKRRDKGVYSSSNKVDYGYSAARFTNYSSILNYGSIKSGSVDFKRGSLNLQSGGTSETISNKDGPDEEYVAATEALKEPTILDDIQDEPTFFHTVAQALVAAGANPDIGNSLGWTPLHYAVEAGSRYIVEALVHAGTKLNHQDSDGNSILHRSVMAERGEIVNYLVAKKHSINADLKNNAGMTPLAVACSLANPEISNLLIKAGSSVTIKDVEGHLPLYHAVMGKSGEVVDQVAAAGASIDYHDAGGQSYLTLAISIDARDAVTSLLRRGASLTFENEDGQTPLYVAIVNRRFKILEFLLEHPKLDVNIADRYGKNRTALHHAVEQGSATAVKLLLTHKANVSVQDVSGATPLHYAALAKSKAADIASLLVKAKADPNLYDHNGASALHYALLHGSDTAVIKQLIIAGVDVNAKRKDGSTALNLAVGSGDPAIVEYFIKRAVKENQVVDPNSKDSAGDTALHIAIRGQQDAIALLIAKELKPDLRTKNNAGKTAIDLASSQLKTALKKI